MNHYRTALLTTRDHTYKGHRLQTNRVRPRQYYGFVSDGPTVGQHNSFTRTTRARVLADLKESINGVLNAPAGIPIPTN